LVAGQRPPVLVHDVRGGEVDGAAGGDDRVPLLVDDGGENAVQLVVPDELRPESLELAVAQGRLGQRREPGHVGEAVGDQRRGVPAGDGDGERHLERHQHQREQEQVAGDETAAHQLVPSR
jgi:hypothetical protein